MKKMSSMFTQRVIRTFVAIQIFVLFFGGSALPLSAKPPVPVLTLDAGAGISAAFSDYSLSNYEVVNGQYRGNFCFTLTNTTQRAQPALPVFLVGMGLMGDTSIIRFTLGPTFIPPEHFVTLFAQETINDSYVETFFAAGDFLSEQLLDGPTDGLGIGESFSICMPLRSATPFTLNDLISRFTVLFSDRVEACYTLTPYMGSTTPTSRIAVTSFGENEFGFRITNQRFTPPFQEVVTGFGFEIDNRSDFSLLSIDPSPQPGSQNLWFSTSRRALKINPREIHRKLDFGLLTGPSITEGAPQFGVPEIATSSVFRIGGDFAGLTTRDILTNALVRVPSGWETIINGPCPGPPTAGSIRGTLATNPR